MSEGSSVDARRRAFALALAVMGLALSAYIEFGLTKGGDRFGWFVYEAAAWLVASDRVHTASRWRSTADTVR